MDRHSGGNPPNSRCFFPKRRPFPRAEMVSAGSALLPTTHFFRFPLPIPWYISRFLLVVLVSWSLVGVLARGFFFFFSGHYGGFWVCFFAGFFFFFFFLVSVKPCGSPLARVLLVLSPVHGVRTLLRSRALRMRSTSAFSDPVFFQGESPPTQRLFVERDCPSFPMPVSQKNLFTFSDAGRPNRDVSLTSFYGRASLFQFSRRKVRLSWTVWRMIAVGDG